MYEGDFVNDKADGNGKHIYDNGDYYIGQFKQAKRHGKGKLYTNNDVLIYDGDFIDDIMDGEGKVIFDDGRYYIGQNKEGIPNGKGTTYDKEGILYTKEIMSMVYLMEKGNMYMKMVLII